MTANTTKSLPMLACLALVSASACAGTQSTMDTARMTPAATPVLTDARSVRDPEAVLRTWPAKSAEVARSAMEAYGQPDEVAESMLIWHNSGPWKMTVAHRDPVQHDFPVPHPDLLEQFIDYEVPPEMFDELAMYDGSVVAERTRGVMSARCDKIGANFLAINLAHDIVAGTRTVEEARSFYAEAIKKAMDGEMHDYMKGFQFELPRGPTGDADTSVLPMSTPSSGPPNQR